MSLFYQPKHFFIAVDIITNSNYTRRQNLYPRTGLSDPKGFWCPKIESSIKIFPIRQDFEISSSKSVKMAFFSHIWKNITRAVVFFSKILLCNCLALLSTFHLHFGLPRTDFFLFIIRESIGFMWKITFQIFIKSQCFEWKKMPFMVLVLSIKNGSLRMKNSIFPKIYEIR